MSVIDLSIIILFLAGLCIYGLLQGQNNHSSKDYFLGNGTTPWWVAMFSIVATETSVLTFISVPGWVGDSGFTYFQVVLGYFAGYFIVAFVLLPIYYKQNLTSIYEYLAERFGPKSHKIGAISFFISRVLGASFRLFLVAIVMQHFIFDAWNVPFEITVTPGILP